MSAFISVVTQDGTYIVRDPFTGLVATGNTLIEAVAELRRLMTTREAA